MIYIKNTNSNKIESISMIPSKAKEEKLIEIKKARDEELVKEHHNSLGKELRHVSQLIFEKTGKTKGFKFLMKATGIPNIEPDTIVNYALRHIDGEFTAYSCNFEDGSKGYVAIDNVIARSLKKHMADRTLSAVVLANIKKEEIKNATTIEEVKSISFLEL